MTCTGPTLRTPYMKSMARMELGSKLMGDRLELENDGEMVGEVSPQCGETF